MSAHRRSFLLMAVLLGCQLDAVAATGVTACNDRIPTAATSSLTLVDYDRARASDATPELLRDTTTINAKSLVLTPEVDTSVRREDHVDADLELPADESLEAEPDAATLLLERRNARLREADNEASSEMNTELPGMDQNEMLQFREQMYRTDI